MALDEPKEGDHKIQEEGFVLVVDNRLLQDVGGIKVDYADGVFRKGFQISALNKGQQCGSGCSC